MPRLPPTYRHEQEVLEAAGIRSWSRLAALADRDLDRLSAAGLATAARLRRLRGQARMMAETGLPHEVAALLLHAGIPDAASLAAARPQDLVTQVGRLRRRLFRGAGGTPDLQQARSWIAAAHSGRIRSQSRPPN
ncbi:DUF4332 domain-containing protein [Synechococcus sp. RSCCF101]|nr:DUF4332 domain-containing protein [Synechococcus sp. RSCCF101]